MSEIYTINRYALLLRPRQHLIDWVNGINPNDPVEYTATWQHDEVDVYLIPEMADTEDGEDWLRDNFLVFFENSLTDWCDDQNRWPPQLDWLAFTTFFDYTLQSMVMDIVSEEEDDEYDNYDDNDEDDDEPDVEGFAAEKDDEFEWEE